MASSQRGYTKKGNSARERRVDEVSFWCHVGVGKRAEMCIFLSTTSSAGPVKTEEALPASQPFYTVCKNLNFFLEIEFSIIDIKLLTKCMEVERFSERFICKVVLNLLFLKKIRPI